MERTVFSIRRGRCCIHRSYWINKLQRFQGVLEKYHFNRKWYFLAGKPMRGGGSGSASTSAFQRVCRMTSTSHSCMDNSEGYSKSSSHACVACLSCCTSWYVVMYALHVSLACTNVLLNGAATLLKNRLASSLLSVRQKFSSNQERDTIIMSWTSFHINQALRFATATCISHSKPNLQKSLLIKRSWPAVLILYQ